MKFRIPVNYTRRAIVEVDTETFDDAKDWVEKMVKVKYLHSREVQEELKNKTISTEDVPWSYEVDIDACDVYQTPEALKQMEKDFI
jgi:hypothetical protein